MEVVNRWVDGGQVGTFEQFKRTDEKGKLVFKANASGTCAFDAMRVAAKILHEPTMYRHEVYEAFVADGLQRNLKYRADQGATEPMMNAFARKLIAAGARINYYSVFAKNLHTTGHFSKTAISRLDLADGVYIIAAMNISRVGHAFVLGVADGNWTVHDENEVISWANYGEWIHRVSFVKKLVEQDK
jgi:hypothetical protein